jgi:glycosyltransferase involved in cell wall biosynthesis
LSTEHENRDRRPVIAIYSICKDERNNIRGWVDSAADADVIVLADTGSQDGSLEIAQSLPGVIAARIGIVPFRFDHARNAALALVPANVDFCLAVDLDERLKPGWRAAIEEVWHAGANHATFLFHWGPGVSFRYDRFHARAGFVWKGAAHEYPSGPGPKLDSTVEIDHLRDQGKDRSHYFDLLKLSRAEEPDDPRHTYYLGREFMYRGEYEPARQLLTAYLKMPNATFDQERSEACRFLARMVWPEQKDGWLLRAISEAPSRRECWADLAIYYQEEGRVVEAAGAAARARSITEIGPDNGFHIETWAWDDAKLDAIIHRTRESVSV